MEYSNRNAKPRNEVDILLAIARRLESEGDAQGAINSYQLALAHLSEDDPRRNELQARVDELERGTEATEAPEAPVLVRPIPATPPEPRLSPPRPRISTVPERTTPQVKRRAPQALDEGPTGRDEPVIRPIWSWLFMGCAVLLGLALPVIVALYFSQLGLPSLSSVGLLAPGQSTATRTPLLPAPAPRAPTAISPSAGESSAAKTKQASILFDDSFDHSTLDGSKWIVDNSSDTAIDLSHGTLRLSSSISHFPYVHSRVNPFPTTGDFSATVRFQYTSAGACGVPIAMASFVLPPGLSHPDTDQLSSGAEAKGISIWFWHNVLYYRAGAVHEDISFNASSGWHLATVEYIGGKYRLAIDNTTVYTSTQTTARPAVIWLGLPFDLGAGKSCQWDSLEISNARVEALR